MRYTGLITAVFTSSLDLYQSGTGIADVFTWIADGGLVFEVKVKLVALAINVYLDLGLLVIIIFGIITLELHWRLECLIFTLVDTIYHTLPVHEGFLNRLGVVLGDLVLLVGADGYIGETAHENGLGRKLCEGKFYPWIVGCLIFVFFSVLHLLLGKEEGNQVVDYEEAQQICGDVDFLSWVLVALAVYYV